MIEVKSLEKKYLIIIKSYLDNTLKSIPSYAFYEYIYINYKPDNISNDISIAHFEEHYSFEADSGNEIGFVYEG